MLSRHACCSLDGRAALASRLNVLHVSKKLYVLILASLQTPMAYLLLLLAECLLLPAQVWCSMPILGWSLRVIAC